MEIVVKLFGFVEHIGFENTGLTLEFRVLVGIERSRTLRGIILS